MLSLKIVQEYSIVNVIRSLSVCQSDVTLCLIIKFVLLIRTKKINSYILHNYSDVDLSLTLTILLVGGANEQDEYLRPAINSSALF